MVYKGAKYLCFLNIGAYIGESYSPDSLRSRGISPAAYRANKAGYAATMSTKASALNNRSAYSVAASAAALPNQSGGNIGFTYE